MMNVMKVKFVRAELRSVNADGFVPRNALDLVVLEQATLRAELAWINRDLMSGTFSLGCALARTGGAAGTIRSRLLEARRTVSVIVSERGSVFRNGADDRSVTDLRVASARD